MQNRETMPWHIWHHEVLCAAGISAKDAELHRERLQRWYQAGEPVWMAADGLRQVATRVARELQHDDGRAAIRAAYRKAVRL